MEIDRGAATSFQEGIHALLVLHGRPFSQPWQPDLIELVSTARLSLRREGACPAILQKVAQRWPVDKTEHVGQRKERCGGQEDLESNRLASFLDLDLIL